MFHRMTPDQWNAVINTNLGSLFNMTRPVIEGMRARKFGRIINISSINGQKGQMGQVNYSAAKAGEIGFTKALAQEGAKSGITVNAICPGYIATEMVKAVPQDVLEKSILPHIPAGRLGEPEEIARCVVFLASDEFELHHRRDAHRQWRAIHGVIDCVTRHPRYSARSDMAGKPAMPTRTLIATCPPAPARHWIGFTAILMWSLLALLTAASGKVPPFQLAAMTFAIGGLLGAVSWMFRKGAVARCASRRRSGRSGFSACSAITRFTSSRCGSRHPPSPG